MFRNSLLRSPSVEVHAVISKFHIYIKTLFNDSRNRSIIFDLLFSAQYSIFHEFHQYSVWYFLFLSFSFILILPSSFQNNISAAPPSIFSVSFITRVSHPCSILYSIYVSNFNIYFLLDVYVNFCQLEVSVYIFVLSGCFFALYFFPTSVF